MITSQTIILSLGGSLIYPEHGIDIIYLRKLNSFVRKHVAEGRRFFIVCGGGRVARYYQNTAQKVISTLTNDDVDWLGIHATRINGHLVRAIFHDIAHPRVVENYHKKIADANEPVIVAAGWKPGWSTDYCAVILARDYDAKTIINMSNIDTLYNKNPNKYANARPITQITWDEFMKYTGDKWTPGANVPFDPIATKLARKHKLTVVIANGNNVENLDNILSGKPFIGTVIRPFILEQSFFDQEYFQSKKGETAGRIIKHTLPLRTFYRALMIKLFLKPGKVLDVGCGLGYMVDYLRRLGIEAYGIDNSRYAVANTLPSVRSYIKEGNIQAIPFADNSFDLVITFDVLEHIPKNDLARAIAECTRVSNNLQFHKIYTKENTWLQKLHGYDPSHVSVFNQSWWEKLWRKNHLKKIYPWWIKLPRVINTSYLLRK